MVDRVSYQVRQWIFDGLDDCLVEFGLLPLHLDTDFLPTLDSQVPYDAGKLAPDVANRLHPGFHHPLLQLGGDEVESLRRTGEGGVTEVSSELQDLIPRQDQFAHLVHQSVK